MIRTYLSLTKPGIIVGNLITAASGFFLASKGHFDAPLFLAMLSGLTLVIASSCTCNNYIDRDLDRKMVRTRDRALAIGVISETSALLFAALLGLSGLLLLGLAVNWLSMTLAAVGFVIYVAIYSLWKTRTTYATLMGSVAGALPPVIGYTAVTNHLDGAALLLFAILVAWQMPHFFSIALFRLEDYSAASIPVLPVQGGERATKVQMVAYIIAFMLLTALLTICGYTGLSALITVGLFSLAWLWLGVQGFKADNSRLWARKMFRFSLLVIMALSGAISVSAS